MLIDTHAHLEMKDYDVDRELVIKRAFDSGIKKIVNIGNDLESSKRAIKLAEENKNIFATISLHPLYVGQQEFDEKEFTELAEHRKVVGIGETGLDYSRISTEDLSVNPEKIKKLQQEVFVKHIALAEKTNKPLILHSRKLYLEMFGLMQEQGYKGKAIFHCYVGRLSQAQEFLKAGHYIGFTGIITYARDYDKLIKNIPLDRILVETDSPYLSPIRGQRNEPANVKCVAETIAQIKQISFEEVAEQTSNNAEQVFGI